MRWSDSLLAILWKMRRQDGGRPVRRLAEILGRGSGERVVKVEVNEKRDWGRKVTHIC